MAITWKSPFKLAGKMSWKGAKYGGITALAVGGLAAASMFVSNLRNNRRYDPSKDHGDEDMGTLANELPPVQTYLPPVAQPGMIAGVPIVTDGPMVQRVRPDMARAAAVNPTMTAVGAEVQDLGATVRQ